MIQKMSKHAIEKSNSPSLGSRTPYTSVTTLPPCANNLVTDFPSSRPKKKRLSREAMTSTA